MSQYEVNQLGCLLIILGLTIPGGELIANACKALAYEQSTLGATVIAAAGVAYMALSIPILLIPGFAANGRLLISLALVAIVSVLLFTKFCITEAAEGNFYLVASEIVPGLAKRVLLISALASNPESSALGRLVHPFLPIKHAKSKKE